MERKYVLPPPFIRSLPHEYVSSPPPESSSASSHHHHRCAHYQEETKEIFVLLNSYVGLFQTSGKLEKAEILEMTVEYLRAVQTTEIGMRFDNGKY